jgi:hypothetical protein
MPRVYAVSRQHTYVYFLSAVCCAWANRVKSLPGRKGEMSVPLFAFAYGAVAFAHAAHHFLHLLILQTGGRVCRVRSCALRAVIIWPLRVLRDANSGAPSRSAIIAAG